VEEEKKETKIEVQTPEEVQHEQQAQSKPETSAEPAMEMAQGGEGAAEEGAAPQPTIESERAAMEGKEQPEAKAESPEMQKLKEEVKESAEEAKKGILEDTYKEVKEVFNYQQLKDTLDSLAHESTVRRVKIKNREGRTVLDVPMWLAAAGGAGAIIWVCLLYTSPSPRDRTRSRMPSSA
jgi:hypothetical protein